MGRSSRVTLISLVLVALYSALVVGEQLPPEIPAISPHLISAMRKGGFDHSEKVWVIFKDKNCQAKNKVELSEEAIRRRQLNGVGPTAGEDVHVCSEYIEAISMSVFVHTVSRWMNGASVTGTASDIREICQSPFVKECTVLATPKTMEAKEERGKIQSYNYGLSISQIEQINVKYLHDNGYTGQNITVAILDTGFDLEHTVFDDLNVKFTWDFIHNNSDVESSISDSQCGTPGQVNHGTSTLSCVAGLKDGTLVGGAPSADMLIFQTECVNLEAVVEEDYYVAALEAAEARGARVVSTSLGYNDWYSQSQMDGKTCITTKAVNIATDLGLIVVVSAGNEGHGTLVAPGDAFDVISVGAVSISGSIASFSSSGPTADGRVKPDVVARGVNDYLAKPGNAYGYASGTSFSCPLVGGLVASVLSAYPMTPLHVLRTALLDSADRAYDVDSVFGYGIPNAKSMIEFLEKNATYPIYGRDELSVIIGSTTGFHIAIDSGFTANTSIAMKITCHTGKLSIAMRNSCVVAQSNHEISMLGSANDFNKALQYLNYDPEVLIINTTTVVFEISDGSSIYTKTMKIHTGYSYSSLDEENFFMKYIALWIVLGITAVVCIFIVFIVSMILIGSVSRRYYHNRGDKEFANNPYMKEPASMRSRIVELDGLED